MKKLGEACTAAPVTLMERNTMRHCLATDAYLHILPEPPEKRLAAVQPSALLLPSVIHCTFTSDGASNLDFGPQLDDLRRRDVEVVPGRARIARHRGEQPLPPHCHAFSGGWDHRRAA